MSNTKIHEVLIGGTGGQGVITIGYILADAASRVYRNVSRFPIYLAMQRGGAAYCTVRFSDDEIPAPILSNSNNAICMDNGSYSRFKGAVKKGGNLLVNCSIVKQLDDKVDCKQFPIPVIDMAKEMGLPAIANMIMLGAYRQVTNALSDEVVLKALEEILAEEGKKDRLKKNIDAYNKGAQYALDQKWGN